MPKILFIMSLAAGITLSCGKDSVDPDNNGGEKTEAEWFYPDDYRPWADFSEREHWGPYNVHDPSCIDIDDREWTYCFSTDAAYGGIDRVGIQVRPGLDPGLMVMHLRKLIWTSDGLPLALPQRYGGVEQQAVTADSITGEWEQISLKPVENGSVKNQSVTAEYLDEGQITGRSAAWELQDKMLRINRNGDILSLHLHHGFDWENNRPTLIYAGLNDEGRPVWGKKIK